MASGHCALLTRNFKNAVQMYAATQKMYPNDPLVNLCLGIALLSRAMVRLETMRQTQILQAFSFLFRYLDVSCSCVDFPASMRDEKEAEAFYNLGRAFHQIGDLNWATVYYERVLDMQAQGDHYKSFAAYNLSLIYVSVGSPILARSVLEKHCSI